MISIISFISLFVFVLPASWSGRRVPEPLLNTNDLINIYGIELVRRWAIEEHENATEDLNDEFTDEDGSEIAYDEVSEQFMSTDDEDVRSETSSPDSITNNRELEETYVFLDKLFHRFTWEYENYYADKIIFKPFAMDGFIIYTSITLAQEQINWSEGTECMDNFIIRNDGIIRKIKYSPILIDLSISNRVCEFEIIRANHFCYSYVEMVYILNFGYNMTVILNKDIDYIFASYLNVGYSVTGSSANEGPIKKYFCVSSDSRCRTIFDHENRDKIQLSSHHEKYHVAVEDKRMLLDLLKDFKKCDTCGHRLQVWIGEIELATIYGVLRPNLSLAEINDKIFDIISGCSI